MQILKNTCLDRTIAGSVCLVPPTYSFYEMCSNYVYNYHHIYTDTKRGTDTRNITADVSCNIADIITTTDKTVTCTERRQYGDSRTLLGTHGNIMRRLTPKNGLKSIIVILIYLLFRIQDTGSELAVRELRHGDQKFETLGGKNFFSCDTLNHPNGPYTAKCFVLSFSQQAGTINDKSEQSKAVSTGNSNLAQNDFLDSIKVRKKPNKKRMDSHMQNEKLDKIGKRAFSQDYSTKEFQWFLAHSPSPDPLKVLDNLCEKCKNCQVCLSKTRSKLSPRSNFENDLYRKSMKLENGRLKLDLFYNENLLKKLPDNRQNALEDTVRLTERLRKNSTYLAQFNKKMTQWVESKGLISTREFLEQNKGVKIADYQQHYLPVNFALSKSAELSARTKVRPVINASCIKSSKEGLDLTLNTSML